MTDIPTIRPPIEPEKVKDRADRFLCTPYRIVLTADTCARRRAMVRAGLKTLEFLHCVDACSVGRVVEAKSGGPMKLSKAIPESDEHQGRKVKLLTAARHGQLFEGDTPRPAQKRRRLTVIDGDRQDEVEPTIPTLGDFMPSARELPKAPPGRRPPSFPPPPAVVAGGVGGAGSIRSTDEGLMVEREGHALAGPFPDIETASRVAGSIDAPAGFELTAPALPPAPAEQGEETTMAKCKHKDGCDKEGRPAVDGHPETEGLCLRHRREAMGKKTKPAPLGRRKARPLALPTGVAVPDLMGGLQQAIEDSALVERIGRDRCRELAAIIEGVRAEARATE